MTILGIDYGGTRTGLAVGNTLMKIAHPLETVTTKKDEEKLVKIQSVIKEWRVGKIVIGIPSSLHHSSTNQSIVAKINNFINLLKENTTLDITSVNEDFSSFGASQALSEQNIKGHKQKKHLDSMAACIILQQYFDEYRSE
jgi:putative Holliday junction resolvase